jgi:NAD(P)-dependent dehydrogenase (short-subunit alcohol dehydrogenase family)
LKTAAGLSYSLNNMNNKKSNTFRDRIVVVAGATRGAGRGIATAFGEAGATVICSGRSTSGKAQSFSDQLPKSDYNRPETIEETAELVTAHGGIGVPFAIDHLDQEQVRQLAEHISETWGQIDVLVNDIWGAEKLKGGPPDWSTPL